ncbi:MAG: DUF1573 domain-containing protein [Reichenbachiella sp.]
MRLAIYISAAILVLSQAVFAQGKLELVEETHDFGTIKEADGPAMNDFELINSGDQPLIISHVKASCGCTTPSWSREPIAPGERGYVQVQYNPRNRPGPFRKTLTITTNGTPAVVRAYIKGQVEPREKTIEEKLPIKIGALRMAKRTYNLGVTTNESVLIESLDFYNDSADTIRITEKVKGPDFIQLKFDTLVIAPNSRVNANLTYDAKHKDNLGMQNHGVVFYTDEAENAAKKINVMITLKEYFPSMTTEEEESAPRLIIADRLKNAGKVAQGEKIEVEYVLSNSGKKKLNIRKLESNCACMTSSLSDTDIKPGKSTTLKVVFDTTKRRGTQNKSVSIYSNDPNDPTQVVTIRASVTQ